MEQKFKIMNILNFQFSKIDELEDVTDESIKNNMTHGVWVLFGRKKEQLWTCLQVGQSSKMLNAYLGKEKSVKIKQRVI